MEKNQFKQFFYYSLLILFLFSCNGKKSEPQAKNIRSDQQEMFDLLKQWCDQLLFFQIGHESIAVDGGIVCPACALMHGRTPDAIYPLLYMTEQTGDEKYKNAAIKLLNWGERNVRLADGSWNNEVNIYSWNGITVFGLIALMESVQDFAYLLDEETRQQCMRTINEQAAFIYSFIKPGVGNINYSASACYALALAGKLTGEEKYTARASELSGEMLDYFTENNNFFFGEGSFPYTPSIKGLRPIDLGYNVEETLPNLLYYADFSGDKLLKEKVIRSLMVHLEFMLPDGAWDNSWGTRNFKWSYWGSRTSDGFIATANILSKENPVFAEAAYRNFELLKKCTNKGLLYGGMHYQSAKYPACIHHTFEHAKSLALALHGGFGKPEKRMELPREKEYGSMYLKDLDLHLVSKGDWKATITAYDVDYKNPGGNAHGGTLSLLWNKKTGPLLAAAMSEFSLIEPANMQIPRGFVSYSSTMRLEYIENDLTYSNVHSKKAVIEKSPEKGNTETFKVSTELVNINSGIPGGGKVPVDIIYSFTGDSILIQTFVRNPQFSGKLRFFIPVISCSDEKLISFDNGYRIEKEQTDVILSSSDALITILPTEPDGRAFNPVPGFEFIPFCIEFSKNISFTIACKSKTES